MEMYVGVYLYGVLVFSLEKVAHLSESGHRPPARLQLARTRNSMAATLHPHQRRNGLEFKRKSVKSIQLHSAKLRVRYDVSSF